MRRIYKKELLEMSNTQDIYVLRKEYEKLILEADLEYWEEPMEDIVNKESDNYRIEVFGNSSLRNDWVLDNDFLKKISLKKLNEQNTEWNFYDLIDDVRGRMCGGIRFYHESNEEREKFSSAVEQLWSMCSEDAVILMATDIEFADIAGCLKDGNYILVLSKNN